MSTTWKTKYGPRRVRQDPPTLDEAIVAARGLTDNLQEQVEIAASLIGLPAEQVRAAAIKASATAARKELTTVAFTGRAGSERAVIVERKMVRRSAIKH